ncbi:MAG: hypothetical protein IJV35_02685 [Neisseriaceae bacterium]|nr:hypothetical protein [Neisseriaceae bacterium]
MNILEIIFNLLHIKSSIPIKKIGSDNYSEITKVLMIPRDFREPKKLGKLENLLKKAQEQGVVTELTDKKYYYYEGGNRAHHFYLKECEQTWRLVYPDYPFCGVWERVREN